jgi:hypothetical protein
MPKEAESLIHQPMLGYRVERMVELYRIDTDGRYTGSEGCFSNEVLARAYAQGLRDPDYTNTQEVIVLTDGTEGYLLGRVVTIHHEDGVLETIRRQARAKLTPEEADILGV